MDSGNTLSMEHGYEAIKMLESIRDKTGYRNSWLNMLKTIAIPYFNSLDPYMTGADDGVYQKRIWALASATYKHLFRGEKSFLYLDNVSGKKAKVTYPLCLEIMGKIFFYSQFNFVFNVYSSFRFSCWYNGCAQEQA